MSDEHNDAGTGRGQVVPLFPGCEQQSEGCRPGLFRPLPARMRGYTRKIRVGETTLYWRTGEYTDGSLGKLEIDIKGSAAMRSIINSYAGAVTVGLQHGVPLKAYVEPYRQAWLAEIVVMVDSPLAIVMQDLAEHYLGWHPPIGQRLLNG